MKKIIASIAALSMCALMLTACGDKTPSEDGALTDSITAEQTAEENNAAADNSSDNDETKAETEAPDNSAEDNDTGSSDTAVSYSSLDEFYSADDVFDHPAESVDRDDTYTYAFNKDFEGATDFYADLESADGKIKIVMAMSVETKQLAIDIEGFTDGSSDITNMSIIMTDGKIYMLEPTSKSGFYMDLDDDQLAEMFDEYDPEALLSEANIDTSVDFEGMMSYDLEIGGRSYTFEFLDNVGMLYDESGKICGIISNDTKSEIRAIVVNEFSAKVSSGAFDIPSGYEIMDIMDLAALGQ